MSHDTEKWCKIWRKTDLFFQQWQNFGEFWHEHSKVSKICTFIGFFCAKYITFDLKKYRGVMLHHSEVEEWCKICRKTDLWFGESQEEFRKVSPEYSKVWKLGLWWDTFIQSRRCMNLKFTQELCTVTVTNDAKFLREIGLLLQIWHERFDKFWLEHLKVSKIYTLFSSFWPKYTMFQLKKCYVG